MPRRPRHEPRRALRRQPLPGGQQAGRAALAGRRVGRGDAGRPWPARISKSGTASPGTSTSGWSIGSTARPPASCCWPGPARPPAGSPRSSAKGPSAKVYWAIVEGSPTEDEGDVDRSDREGPRRESVAHGRPCGPGRQGGGCRLPRARAVVESGQAGASAIDRTESSAQGAVGKPGAADPGRWEIWGEGPDRGGGWRESARTTCQGVELHSPDAGGSDCGRGAGAGRLARALAIASGIAVRVQ